MCEFERDTSNVYRSLAALPLSSTVYNRKTLSVATYVNVLWKTKVTGPVNVTGLAKQILPHFSNFRSCLLMLFKQNFQDLFTNL